MLHISHQSTLQHSLSYGDLVKNFSHLSRYLIVIFPKYLVFIEISYKCGYHDITIYTISPSILCQFCRTSSEVVQPLEKHKNQLGEKIRLQRNRWLSWSLLSLVFNVSTIIIILGEIKKAWSLSIYVFYIINILFTFYIYHFI